MVCPICKKNCHQITRFIEHVWRVHGEAMDVELSERTQMKLAEGLIRRMAVDAEMKERARKRPGSPSVGQDATK